MPPTVTFTDDPSEALRLAGTYLASDPISHNLILTLLHQRIALPQPGRYWIAVVDGQAQGFAFQSPIGYFATLTPMDRETSIALADAMARFELPGAQGEAATAAAFAGRLTELRGCAAKPTFAGRIYRFEPAEPTQESRLRLATPADHDLLVDWFQRFAEEISESHGQLGEVVNRITSANLAYVWDDGLPRSLASHTQAVEGVTRIQRVFTPPEMRNRGYAGACVAALSNKLAAEGLQCILYTDLANKTSNSVYRKVGYRAVSEVVRYEFK